MSGSTSPQASSGAPGADFAVVSGLILANGWAGQAQIDRIKPLVGGDTKQMIRALVEQNILPPDAAGQLDLLLQQQAQLPNFRLIKKLGAGGMGTVYLATHLATGDQVALKVISTRLVGDSEFLNRFHRETKALVGLRHPHLANIIESGSQGVAHYLAMEHVNGPSLAGMLKEYRALPEHYVLGLVHQLADCLNYVYQKAGLVHRDIKPENVLVNRTAGQQELFPDTDQAKLIDFGLVKTTNDDEHLTQTGMTIGTPLYMSPEQVRGEKLDCRSDIYGLGATTFHLLTGMPPFRGSSPGAIMSAHLTQPTPDPGTLVPGLSASVRRLVMTAMAKNADERYVTFDAFLKACDDCLEQAREKHGGSIKLLRKPLVINKKPAITGHDPHAPAAQPVSERIQKKHAEKKAADVDLPDIAAGNFQHPSVREHSQAPGSASNQRTATAPGSASSQRTTPAPGSASSQRTPAPGAGTPASGSARVQATGKPGTNSVSGRPAAAAPAKPVTHPISASRPPPGGADTPAGGTATAALARAHTDKIRGKKELPKTAPAPGPDLSHSAVYAEDPKETAGTGLVPWLILGLAVIIAVAYGVWRMMGG